MKGILQMNTYGMKKKHINGIVYFYDNTKIIAKRQIEERGHGYGKANKRKAI